MTKFDIIVPSIGRLTLLSAIESVIHQDYPHWNLWVVCDGIGGLEKAIDDKRVTVIGSDGPRHEDWGAWARNKGVSLGDNPWIAYIDDDDVWYPNHLSTFLSLLAENPQATMLRTAGLSFSWRRKTPRTKDRIRRLGAVNSADILTVGMAHTRELFKRTTGWLACDNHDKILWNSMKAIGGITSETDAVTFEFER